MELLEAARRILDARSKKLDYVAPAEIDEAIILVVRLGHGLPAEQVPIEACTVLGFSRVTAGMRSKRYVFKRCSVPDGSARSKI